MFDAPQALPAYIQVVEEMSDAKILGISVVTNQVEIKGCQLGVQKIKDVELLNFANAMLIDYQNYNNIMFDFMRRNQIVAKESPYSYKIEEDGNKALKELTGIDPGPEFDKRFLYYQASLLEQTLDYIDHLFLPNVTNVELKNLITTIRPAIQSRLEWAARIHVRIGS